MPNEPLWVVIVSFVHPALVTVGLFLALLALRSGLKMRSRARLRLPTDPEGIPRHLRYGKPAATMLIAGFALGPLTTAFVRGWSAMDTFHGWTGLTAIALYSAIYFIGRRLETGRSTRAALHGNLGLLALAISALAAVTGIELLP